MALMKTMVVLLIAQAWASLVAGTYNIPTGAVCLVGQSDVDDNCVSSSYCNATSAWSGTCTTDIAVGKACPGGNCADGSYCLMSDDSNTGVCTKDLAAGAACTDDGGCADDSYCLLSTTSSDSGVCTKDLEVGAACTGEGDESYVSGAFCDTSGGSSGTVTNDIKSGAACTNQGVSYPCAEGYYCPAATGVCTAQLADGKSCVLSDDSPCSDVGGCYSADTTGTSAATNGTCVQCRSDGDCEYQKACSTTHNCVAAQAVDFNVKLPAYSSAELTPGSEDYTTLITDIQSQAPNATSGGIVNSVDVNAAAVVSATVVFTTASGAATTFARLLTTSPATVFPNATFGNVTVSGVEVVSGAGMLSMSLGLLSLVAASIIMSV